MEGTVSSNEIALAMGAYVDELKERNLIRSDPVEQAFRTVPRHKLVERFLVPNKLFSSQGGYREVLSDPERPSKETLDIIYSHHALVTRLGADGLPTSSTSMPGLVANMLELLRLERGHRVLEIGAGTGYNAALISEIVGLQAGVVSIDIQSDVVDQARRLLRAAGYGGVKVVAGDGFYGVPEEAPFDRVVATVGLFDVSPHWSAQLAPEGEMLLPLYQGGAAPLLALREHDGRLLGSVVGQSGFMPIQGEMRAKEQVGGSRGDHPESSVKRLPGWGLGSRDDRWNLWFFVTASDSRGSLLQVPGLGDGDTWSKWTFGLADGESRVVVDDDELVVVGAAAKLRDRLEELRDEWETRGRPQASSFALEFVAKESYAESGDALAIKRRYYVETIKLGQ